MAVQSKTHRSRAVQLLGLQVQTTMRTWMFIPCVRCVVWAVASVMSLAIVQISPTGCVCV